MESSLNDLKIEHKHEKKTKKSKRSRSNSRKGHRDVTETKHKKSRSKSHSKSKKHKKDIDLSKITISKDMEKIIDKKKLSKYAKQDRESIKLSSNFKENNSIKKQVDHSIEKYIDLCKNLLKHGSNSTDTISLPSEETNHNSYNYSSDILLNYFPEQKQDLITKVFPVSSGTQHRILEDATKNQLDHQVFVLGSNLAEKDTPKLNLDKNLGIYTGRIDVKFLTPEELEGNTKAWTKKDLLSRATPITDGVGKKLLEKMGWKQGQGLGKHQEGPVEPIKLDIKTNRKGLVSDEDDEKIKEKILIKQLDGKHPVSILLELSRVRKWPEPVYEIVQESGPDHLKNFLIKVNVNNTSYQPDKPSSNKKLARANAAYVCLTSLGFVMKPPN